MAKPSILDKQGRLFIEVDAAIYTKRAIMETAYKFTDQYYISVDEPSNAVWHVYIKPKNEDASKEALMDLHSEFHNELLDRQLRVEMEMSFKEIREMIVRQAFWPRDLTSEGNNKERRS